MVGTRLPEHVLNQVLIIELKGPQFYTRLASAGQFSSWATKPSRKRSP
jgi:hypothetical protein